MKSIPGEAAAGAECWAVTAAGANCGPIPARGLRASWPIIGPDGACVVVVPLGGPLLPTAAAASCAASSCCWALPRAGVDGVGSRNCGWEAAAGCGWGCCGVVVMSGLLSGNMP